MIIPILILLLIVALAVLFFYHHQHKLKVRAHLMREAVRNRDFTFHLSLKGLFYGEKALQEALNDLGQEINKLVYSVTVFVVSTGNTPCELKILYWVML